MSLKLCLLLILLTASVSPALSQPSMKEYYITGNGNLYVPVNHTQKGMYPIVGYDKEAEPKLLIGGIGVGLSIFAPLYDKITLKAQGNISKHTYWDEPYTIVDQQNNAFGTFLAGSSDFTIGLTATAHYFLTERFSFGTGLGGQILLISLSRLPELDSSKGSIAVNHNYKPFVPTLPVELSLKFPRTLYNVRYEHGLLNRTKGELKEYKKDNYGLLIFEVGFRI